MPNIEENDIVQITDEGHNWFPCLVIVSDPMSWGVQGYVSIPNNDPDSPSASAYIRLQSHQFERVGKAVIVAD